MRRYGRENRRVSRLRETILVLVTRALGLLYLSGFGDSCNGSSRSRAAPPTQGTRPHSTTIDPERSFHTPSLRDPQWTTTKHPRVAACCEKGVRTRPTLLARATRASVTGWVSSSEDAKRSNTYSLTLPRSFQRHLDGGKTLSLQEPNEELMSGATDVNPSPVGIQSMVRNPVDQIASPEVDSQPSKSPVRRELGSQRVFSPYQKIPPREGWRSGLPPTPRSSATKQD